jgi:hypothetical protein
MFLGEHLIIKLFRYFLIWGWRLLTVAVLGVATPALSATCSQATSQGVSGPPAWQTYCWLDMTSYSDATARTAGGQNFSFTLSDGATLTFNLRVTSTTATAAQIALVSIASPSWTLAAFGNSSFVGIGGKPILYTSQAGTKTTFAISSILITPPPGVPAITAYAFVAADGESTAATSPTVFEQVKFVTDGGAWVLLDSVAATSGPNMPTQAGIGTATFTATGNALDPVGGYVVGSSSPTTITTTLTPIGGNQGALFAVRFASLRLNKTVTGARVNATDQFKFDIKSTGTGSLLATGTSTGTGNGPFTAAAVSLASGIPLTIAESMATGSTSALTQYRSQLNCVNDATGSSTVVPSNLTIAPSGGTASYNFGTLQFGDGIQCTFNNAAFPHLRLQKALGTGGRLFNTDQFLMDITQGATSIASTTTTGTGTTITTGATALTQVTAGTAYSMTEAAAGTAALNQYASAIACTNAAATSSTALPTTVGGSLTPQLGDVISCTVTNTKRSNNAMLTIVKSSAIISDPVNNLTNPKMIPGAIVRYALLVANSGTQTVDSNSIFIIDTLPTMMSIGTAASPALANGTPTANMSLTPATDIRYSNQATAPATFAACSAVPHNYTPTSAYDPSVRHICIRPQGTMAASTGAGQPNFTVSFQTQIK